MEQGSDLTAGRSELQEFSPRVFISNFFGAKKGELLRAAGITHVLNVTWDLPFARGDWACHRVAFADNTGVTLPLDECFAFLDSALASSDSARVLLHCAAGSSRSGAIAVAWVMRLRRVCYAQALAELQKMRPVVLPNPGFAEQLVAFERRLLLQ